MLRKEIKGEPMSSVFEKRRIVVKQVRVTQFSRDELHAVAPDVDRILQCLLLTSSTGRIEIDINQGGLCEISFSEKG